MDDMDNESEELGGKARFFVNEYEKYSWSKLLDTRLGGFERLNLYVEALLKMPQNPNLPQLFRNILKDAFLPYRDPETLNLFLKEINGFTYEHSEKLGDAFEYLLSVMDSQGDAGQFRTPRHIIDFIVEVVDPKKDDTILDPACGTAGFLISSYKHILKQNTIHRLGDQLTPDEKTKLMQHFVGYDISPDMVRLSLVNMYLHSFPNPNVFEYDTLTSEEHWDETYDVIMANPPFMSPKGGIRPHKRFSIQANRSEVLFVDYIAEHITTHGRAGVIVPEGIIFQSGVAYKALRKMLVEKYLFAVVSLPAGVFQPYSGVKTSILLMDKQLAKKSDSILFVKVENDGFDLGAQRRAIEKNDLTEALSILQKYKQALNENTNVQDMLLEEETTLATVVEKAKIAKNGDYNLSRERYKESIIRQRQKWPLVELGELFETKSGATPLTAKKREYYENGNIYWVKTKDLNNSYIYDTEEKITEIALKETHCVVLPIETVLIAMYGGFNQIGRTGILKVPAATNQAITALLPNPKVNPYFLNQILIASRYKWRLVANSTRKDPNITKKDILEFKIPLPPLEVQQEFVAELESYQKIIDGAKQVTDNYEPKIKIDPDWLVVEIGDLFLDTKLGIVKDKSEQSATYSLPYLKMNNIVGDGRLDLSSITLVEATNEEFQEYSLRDGDFIYNTRNAPNLVGKSAVYHGEDNKFIFNNNILRIRFKDQLDPDFANLYLNSSEGKMKVKSLVNGTTSVAAIYQKDFASLTIPLPPLEIQIQIVSQIKEEQKRVQATKELVEIFEQKIKDKIAEVWGELEVSEAEVTMPSQSGTFKQPQRVQQVEALQEELGLA